MVRELLDGLYYLTGIIWIWCLFSGIFMFIEESGPKQTQAKVEGKQAQYSGSDGGTRPTPEAERSQRLSAQPSLPSSSCAAGRRVPNPAQS